ncbi:MAG: NAD(P)/FAD-dependent oxidoreductase [Polyangiales bacterium]
MGTPHVVIVGGGFGGLKAARALADAPVRVTLVDRQNHHLFQPLLYQVATAALNPSEIATPIRHILKDQANVTVLLAEATRVEVAAKKLHLVDGVIEYDFLILATGATHSYFGNDGWAPFAPGLKSIEDAVDIRQRFLLAFEAAEREADPVHRRAWLTFVVIGAGPTGVEMAGAMSEVARKGMRSNFRNIHPDEARVILIEGVDRVLPTYTPKLSEAALERLKKRGVEVRLGARVTYIDDDEVRIGDERIHARTVVWAAGVAGSPLARTLGAPLDRQGRVLVEPTLAIPDHPEVFVVGDLATLMQDGKPIPGVAQNAIQGGEHAAKNILRALDGEAPRPFRYKDLGSMAVIGRNAAVAWVGDAQFSGFFAWLVWLVVHLIAIIDFRNRVFVLLQWAWSYVFLSRGARLITRKVPPTLLSYAEDPSLPPPEPRAPEPVAARADGA